MIDYDLITQIKRSTLHVETDDSLEKQIIRATNKLAYEGKYVANPMLAACAEIMIGDYDPGPTEGCSNGRLRFEYYAPPR